MKCKLVNGTKENLKATVEKLGIRGKMDLKPVIETVQQVIDNIRDNGDKALLGYTEKFDGVKLEASQLRVTDEEIAAAKASIDPELMGVMERAAANIRAFHEKQKEEGFMTDVYSGAKVGVRVRPISIAGVYVTGGTPFVVEVVLKCNLYGNLSVQQSTERVVFVVVGLCQQCCSTQCQQKCYNGLHRFLVLLLNHQLS